MLVVVLQLQGSGRGRRRRGRGRHPAADNAADPDPAADAGAAAHGRVLVGGRRRQRRAEVRRVRRVAAAGVPVVT